MEEIQNYMVGVSMLSCMLECVGACTQMHSLQLVCTSVPVLWCVQISSMVINFSEQETYWDFFLAFSNSQNTERFTENE